MAQSIGQLWVQIGAQIEGFDRAQKVIQNIAATAQQMTAKLTQAGAQTSAVWSGVTRELGTATAGMSAFGREARQTTSLINGIGRAMKNVSLDAKLLSGRADAMIAQSRARALAGAKGPGAAIMAELAADLGSGGGTVVGKRSARTGEIAPDMFNSQAKPRTSWASFMAGAPDPNAREILMEGTVIGRGPGGKGPGGRKPPGQGGGGRRGGGGAYGGAYGPLGDVAGLRRVFLGAGIYQGVQYLGDIADSYTNVQNRLRLVNDTEQGVNTTFGRLKDIANGTRSSLDSTAEAYVRIKLATKSLNLSSEDQYKLVERINKAFAMSGASSSEASAAMLQLTQAFNKGKLDGDEFRSLAENMPTVLRVLAKTMKVPEEQLFALSRQGRITRKVLADAFLQANEIDAQFAKSKGTFATSWQTFKNNLMEPIGKLLGDPRVQKAFVDILGALSKIIILLARALPPLIGYITKFISALQDGKPWAIGLGIAIGAFLLPQIIAMVLWMGRLVALPITGFISQMQKLRALAGGNFGSFGGGAPGVGGVGASGAGGAGATGAGAGGAAGFVGPITTGLAVGYAAHLANTAIRDKLVSSENDKSWWDAITGDTLNTYHRFGGNVGSGIKSGYQNAVANQTVTIGPTTVNIQASDMTDAQEKFSQEALDKAYRHAAANFNRPGS
jgi:tape measure domain-containing protein